MNYLAVQRKVAASTQTQALNAIVFLYRDVLVIPLGEMSGLNRIQQHKRIPVVMTPGEGSAVLSEMSGTRALMAQLMFGSGLRVDECCTLRVRDIDFGSSIVNVRNGKGGKYRATVPPSRFDLRSTVSLLPSQLFCLKGFVSQSGNHGNVLFFLRVLCVLCGELFLKL